MGGQFFAALIHIVIAGTQQRRVLAKLIFKFFNGFMPLLRPTGKDIVLHGGGTELRSLVFISGHTGNSRSVIAVPHTKGRIVGGIIAIHLEMGTHDGHLIAGLLYKLGDLAVKSVFADGVYIRPGTKMLHIGPDGLRQLADIGLFTDKHRQGLTIGGGTDGEAARILRKKFPEFLYDLRILHSIPVIAVGFIVLANLEFGIFLHPIYRRFQ